MTEIGDKPVRHSRTFAKHAAEHFRILDQIAAGHNMDAADEFPEVLAELTYKWNCAQCGATNYEDPTRVMMDEPEVPGELAGVYMHVREVVMCSYCYCRFRLADPASTPDEGDGSGDD